MGSFFCFLFHRITLKNKKGNNRGLTSGSDFTLLIVGADGIPSELIIWQVEEKKEELKRHQLAGGEPFKNTLDQTERNSQRRQEQYLLVGPAPVVKPWMTLS